MQNGRLCNIHGLFSLFLPDAPVIIVTDDLTRPPA